MDKTKLQAAGFYLGVNSLTRVGCAARAWAVGG